MNGYGTFEVSACIEVNVDALIDAIMREYEEPLDRITDDDIFEYIGQHVTYMKGQDTSCIRIVEDGWPISRVGDELSRAIEQRIAERKAEADGNSL